MTRPAVIAHDLHKSYGDTVAVDGLSLTIQPGETFGIAGVNGAGKTTTVELVAGLRPPDSGHVEVLGLDPHRDRAALRQVLTAHVLRKRDTVLALLRAGEIYPKTASAKKN